VIGAGLVVWFSYSTILLWHSTFLVDSFAHVSGDPLRHLDNRGNTFLIALVTGGAGWHNNHHRYQSAAGQGFGWWRLETTYYGLRVLARLGIVCALRPCRCASAMRRADLAETGSSSMSMVPTHPTACGLVCVHG
jgi:fatty-acid desaturase